MRRQTDVRLLPLCERRRRNVPDIARHEDSAVSPGEDDTLSIGIADRERRMPVRVHIRQKPVRREARPALRQPVRRRLEGAAAVFRDRTAKVATEDRAVGIARVDGDRQVVPTLHVAQVHRAAAAQGTGVRCDRRRIRQGSGG